jgi:arylsulfatase
MCSNDDRARLGSRMNIGTLSRRSILLAGTTFAAASAFGADGQMQVAKAQAPSTQAKPNILFILVDNLGYGELGVYGGSATRGAPTPRIDKLASEGLRHAGFADS